VLCGAHGRDDLGTLARVGANAVRVDSAFGLESKHDHGAFLTRAQELGLHVLLGFHTQMLCPKYDCFDSWKRAAGIGLDHGYKNGSGWHSAVSMLILQDNPDGLNFGGVTPQECGDDGHTEAECRVKAVLSAMDGVLMAEKERGVKGTVNMTVAWSSDIKDSIDGKCMQCIGMYGFQDMVAGAADPSIAGYKLRSTKKDFQAAFANRWTHSINSAATWAYIKEQVSDKYVDKGFAPKPWFLAEFKGSGISSSQLTKDLQSMTEEGANKGYFMGANIYQFQNDYTNPNPQLFGLFGLGDSHSGTTTDVCQEDVTTHAGDCRQWPAYCLQVSDDTKQNRAPGVATAWKGSADALHGQCTKFLSKASIINTVNSTNVDSRPTSPEQSGVRVVV